MADFQYNAANEKTYQDILSGYKAQQANYQNAVSGINAGYSKMISDNQNVGQSDRIALGQQYAGNLASAQQSAVSRGLGNTNVLDSLQRGVNYDYANATTNLNDSLYRRNTDLQNQQLQFQGQAAAQQGAYALQGLGYQGDTLNQRYNAEAQYVSQLDLNRDAARIGLKNQAALQDQSAMYAAQAQARSFQNADYMQSKYGYYS